MEKVIPYYVAKNLTSQQKVLMKKILEKRDQVSEISEELGLLYILCKKLGHKIYKRSESAVCCVCGEYFGWWCPDSEDHLCHYPTKEECEDSRYYYESCKYCGNPQERK